MTFGRDLHDYLKLPDEHPTWLVDGIIPNEGLINLYGAPKSMKSFLAIQLGIALASGHDTWLGHAIKEKAKVYYLQIDTPRSLWKERFRNMARAGLPLGEVEPGMLTLADRQDAPRMFNITDPSHAAWLRDAVKGCGARLVILDTLRKLYRGDENDSAVSDLVLTHIQMACAGAAVILISHGKKPPTDERHEVSVVDGNRGSSNVAAACDTIMQLKRKGREGTLAYQGRATEDMWIHLLQDPTTLLWQLTPEEETKLAIKRIIADPTYPSERAKARALSIILNKPEDTCKTMLRRHTLPQ